jgi:glycosyltransferase involved in cell wall biosynthesis
MAQRERIGVVVPVLDEAEQIGPFVEAVGAALAAEPVDWEILFVDDGSSDGTGARVRAEQAAGRPVRLLTLARNFGKEAALTAGLDHVDADAVIPMDVDLQDPPELLPAMLARWRAGAEVVLAERTDRAREQWLKRHSAGVFHRLMSLLGEIPLPVNVGDFRLLDRCVVEAVRRMPERTRYMKGILSWPGFRTDRVTYDRPLRQRGSSRQSWPRLFALAFDGITSFSYLPLRLVTVLGGLTALLAMLYMGWIIASTLAFGREVPGYASIMTTILFVGGVQILFLGIVGEYVARVFIEVKGRPIYVLRDTGEHAK